jgi:hypothetical protein
MTLRNLLASLGNQPHVRHIRCMKLLPTLFFAALVLSTPSVFAANESLQQILSDGTVAFQRGDLATAKRNFEIVVQLDPKNQVAQNYLRMVQTQLAAAPKGNAIEKQLSSVVLPKVDFRDASVGSVFDYLRQQVPKLTKDKMGVSFVLQVPADVLQNKTISLQLSNVPFPVALKYVCDLAEMQAVYEQYAIRITPRGTAPAKPATAPEVAGPPKIPGLAE